MKRFYSAIFLCMFICSLIWIGYKTHWSVPVCLFLFQWANNYDRTKPEGEDNG
jgi:hypothetical protein